MFVCDVIDVIYILGVFMTNLHVQSWASGGEGGGAAAPSLAVQRLNTFH